MKEQNTSLGSRAAKTFTFSGRKYIEGRIYYYDELPRRAQMDVLAQADDLEARYGIPAKGLIFQLVVVPHEMLLDLLRRYGASFEEISVSPDVRREIRKIERGVLESPPIGQEGWEKAFAFAFLRRDMPYFSVVEPLESPFEHGFFPPPLALDGPVHHKPQNPMFKEMREGFWRMIQRIHFGIPGFKGTGYVHGSQFVGGLAGINTGWTLWPYMTPMIDAVPIAGFYLWGIMWPQILKAIGLPKNSSKIIEQLEAEFGAANEWDLMKGTEPYERPVVPRPPISMPPSEYGQGKA